MRTIDTPQIKVTLMRSLAGCSETQRKTLVSLGLPKRGASRVLPNVNPILGQINKMINFIKVEPYQESVK
jgi:large subunit ribosomal protein L30